MLTRETIERILRENHAHMVAEYGVKRIGIFGSYAKGVATEKSDIDFVVEFNRPIGFRFVEFVEFLEDLFGKPVDVLTPAGVEAIRIDEIARSIEETTVYV
ncbi:MAG: nucleotidyltransferase family protein [Anaerolineae bacterium]|nr:nucleotidyltransferase family protein [Anaerolineae bacterium]